MSDGGKRSSSYCKCGQEPFAWLLLQEARRTQSTNDDCSPLLRRPELWHSLCSSPSTCRSSKNPRPTISLKHPLWHYTIHSQRAKPHTTVLEGHTAKHTAYGLRICHLLFLSKCATPQGESARCGESRCSSQGSRAFELAAKTEQHGKPGDWRICANMGRLHHDAYYGAESPVRE